MEDLATKILPLVQFLIPGFVTTVIFYWLSESPKPSQFERTIQALIGTGLISILVLGIELVAKWIGSNWQVLGPWNDYVATIWSVVCAILLGLSLAFAANNDTLYALARKLRFTSRASYSEWCLVFRKYPKRCLVLHLLDGRRLCGYPRVWPTDPNTGHFLLEQAAWIVDDTYYECSGEFVLIGNSDIHFVEVLK
ncbi:hypothetical protein FQZ97_973630 [compost metagenome]